MTDPAGLLAGGGITGVVVALAYAVRQLMAARAERASGETDERSTTVKDAATTSALLLDALRDERAEKRQREQRIDELEAEVEKLRGDIFDQRRRYEEQIAKLELQARQLTEQVRQFRLHLDGDR